MPLEEVTLYEERCDRCRALLETRRKSPGGKDEIVKRRAESAGSVKVEMNGEVVVSYDKVCPVCHGRLGRLVESMGVIDRTRGGKPVKKKGSIRRKKR